MQQSYRPFPPQGPQRSPAHASVARRGIGPMVATAHPQTSLTPTQMQAQQEAQRQASQQAKLRSLKPTDKNMPDGVEEHIIGDGVQRYRELRDVERKLDAAMMRKRLDIQDARNRNVKRYRTLRIWVSNTAEDQPWQGDGLDVDAFDFSLNMNSSYRVKIEGRLLDDDLEDSDDEDETSTDQTADAMDEQNPQTRLRGSKPGHRTRFSHFFKSMTVDFERSRTKDGAEQNVEWKKPVSPLNAALASSADFDQLEFKRGGDENVNININFVRDEANQERFRLSPALAEIMDTTEATRAEAVTGIWEYIKMMGLQEDDEKRSFRCDELLKAIFQRDIGYVPYIPEVIINHMSPLTPIKLQYTIRVDQEFQRDPQPTIYDLRVTVDDPLTNKLKAFNASKTYPLTLLEIKKHNDDLALLIRKLSESKAKHNFLNSLSKDPGNFFRKWVSSQKRDMEVMAGEATRGGGEDASAEEWRHGGADGIWGTENVRESVNLMLSSRPR